MEPKPTGVTRRQFLRTMAALGGSTAVWATLDSWALAKPPRQELPQLDGPVEGVRLIILGAGMAGMTMAGMMTADDMRALAAASGTEFDRLWLEMMIAHHEGAIAMAGQVDTTSQDPQVKALADAIVIAQNEEITTMQKLLAR